MTVRSAVGRRVRCDQAFVPRWKMVRTADPTLLALIAVVLLLCAGPAVAVAPRLVVVVAIDQFPYEYLERFEPLFGPDGFRRLVRGGANYTECRYGHLVTATGPGHAVMLTGTDPVHNGIVNNTWYDRVDGQERGCVDDTRFPIVGLDDAGGAPHTGVSPLALSTTTVGDGLRIATGLESKVVAVSIKNRAAVLMAGWRPNGAYWFDEGTCRFVTSTYYMSSLPSWVERFNGSKACASYVGRSWQRLRREEVYRRVADIDDAPYEVPAYGLGRTFPHRVEEGTGADRFAAVVATPFGNDLVLRFAEAAVDAERLGRNASADLLLISFSSNDLVGHAFGPHSQEVADTTAHTDAVLAELMRFLDRKVGQGQWLLALTSDHGVAPVPEHLEKLGVLQPRPDNYHFDVKAARTRVEQALTERFFDSQTPPDGFPGFFVSWGGRSDPFVWINAAAGKQLPKPLTYAALLAAIKEEIGQVEGVARVYAVPERAALAASRDPFDQRAYRSWQLPNGGDLLIQLAPYWLPVEGGTAATTHKTTYEYDTHVPLLLYGSGIRAGRYDRSVGVTDLAPTLADVLGIDAPPTATGEVLREALRGAGG